MEIIKRTNIFIKTRKESFVRQMPCAEKILCGQCGVMTLTVQNVANSFGISTRLIYRLIESESVHFIENDINEIYICPYCIKQILEKFDNE